MLLATRSARCCGSSGTEIIAPQHARLFEPVPHTFLSHQLHRDDFDDFVTGGLGFWVPAYLRYRDQSPAVGMTIFGLITVVAGLVSTLLGGVIADKLRSRLPGS